MAGMTEEALLEFTETCFQQMKEIMPDEDNIGDCRKLYQNICIK